MKLLLAILAVTMSTLAHAGVPEEYTLPNVGALPVSNDTIHLLFSLENSIWDTNPSLDQALAQVARVAWLEARNFPSGMDRAYLIALSIDFYNSLGPESSVCPPREIDAYDNPEQQRCGKEKIWYKYIHPGLRHEKVMDEFEQYWNKEDPQYWWYFFLTQVEISGPNEPMTIHSADLDVSNPTNYAKLKYWMANMATAVENNIPPWDAEEWTFAHCNDWGGCDGLEFELEETDEAPEADDTTAYDDTTEAVGHIGNVVKSPEPEPSSPEQDEKTVNPLRVWGALGAVVLFGLSIGLFAIFRGRRKPD